MDNDKTLEEERKLALHYIVPIVEIAREAFLILDSNLRVLEATPFFYETFKVTSEETKDRFIYDLGNKQWDIPELRKLLEQVLPEKVLVSDYAVTHDFPGIGQKTMLLNARQIDALQLIIIAIEDVTEKKGLEERLKNHTKDIEKLVDEKTTALKARVEELEQLNSLMIGREVRMSELKKENKKLKEPK